MDEFHLNREKTIQEFKDEYAKDASRPSLSDMIVSYRMRADGLTIREIRLKLATRKAGLGDETPRLAREP